jgi:hypothetical protein
MAHVGLTRDAKAGAGGVPEPFDRMYTPAEIASMWQLSQQTVRRLFQDRPGVLKIGDSHPRGRRSYITLRIPVAVVAQVFQERTR